MCREWETIDPHQKSVLSDELGVGFTTYLLFDQLKCLLFVDTLYLAKKFPSSFGLRGSGKVGSRKSPDYIGFTPDRNYFILECKGTQTSRKALQNALNNGRSQKSNFIASDSSKLRHSLVAGLFISPHSHKEESLIRIADPTWSNIDNFLNSTSGNSINDAIIQIALAKHFSIAGLLNLSRRLTEDSLNSIELSGIVREEILAWLGISPDSDGFRTPLNQPSTHRFSEIESQISGIRFLVRTPDNLLSAFLESSQSIVTVIREQYSNYVIPYLDVRPTHNEVHSLGFRFKLDIESSRPSI